MKRCYISRNYKDIRSAGGKAKTDIESIMDKMGFVNIGLRRTTHKNKILDFLLTFFGVVKAMFSLGKGDVLVLQYPMKKYYEMVCNRAHSKGAKVITQIHDLGSFRRKKLTIEQEIERLNHSDAIIAHNPTMQKWLIDNGCKANVVVLGIFDYLSPEPVHSTRTMPSDNDYSVFFVGNLGRDQNAFVYDLADGFKKSMLYLYGNKYDKGSVREDAQVKYLGFAVDHKLMEVNEGDFGLSWYGESLEEGKGKIGEYMAYNNPHKVSLYLRCHAPVILSKTAGLASFVEENKCGVCVDDLTDLEAVLQNISLEEYISMRNNAVKVSDRIASGYYFSSAFEKAAATL
ncbi:MAG: galactofuranosyltransferase [Bacteroidales bacterium]|nr:galactofuranosyltransferase [Bacteroidales bacterium]